MYGTEFIGSAIKSARKKNGYTQEALAELLRVTPTHIKHIESGRRLPSVELLFSAALLLHFSLDSLLPSNSENYSTPLSSLDSFVQQCSKKELDLLEEIAKAIVNNR
ncbi:MAG: helix-turn-helix transcriptional regulator [Clostridia bacterium]|nr:helix-turn-helix transcriptional regulator [Clostridia bacterium]